MNKEGNASTYLKSFWQKKQVKNPKFSLRLVAKKLKLSPAFVSGVLNGKRELPLTRVLDFSKVLELDSYATRKLVRLVVNEHKLDSDTKSNLSIDLNPKPNLLPKLPSESFHSIEQDQYTVLQNWFYLPMLDLVGCEGFRPDSKWIADRLWLKVEVAEAGWKKLVEKGFVCEVDGNWTKKEDRILFPAARIDPRIQKYQIDLLNKCIEQLTSHRSESDFDNRLMLSISLSANPANFGKAKKYLEEAILHAAEQLNEGPGSEVYHLGIQLFPLTKSVVE